MLRQAHAKVSTQIPDTQIYLLPLTSCWFPPPAISFKSDFFTALAVCVLIFLFFRHDYVLNAFCWSLWFHNVLHCSYLNMIKRNIDFYLFIYLCPFLLPQSIFSIKKHLLFYLNCLHVLMYVASCYFSGALSQVIEDAFIDVVRNMKYILHVSWLQPRIRHFEYIGMPSFVSSGLEWYPTNSLTT